MLFFSAKEVHKNMNKCLISLSFLVFSQFFVLRALAADFRVFEGQTSQETDLDQALGRIKPGTILIIGEQHELREHQGLQLEVIRRLKAKGLAVNIGMEFLEYPDQALVDQFVLGATSETDFLREINWTNLTSFNFYRDQILASKPLGKTFALNAPRWLARKISQFGIESLTASDKIYFPPDLIQGNANYRLRFERIMGAHVPLDKIDRYFWAQSLWDDTMAWKAHESFLNFPNSVLVIVVGEFHVQYGGGLPDRLKQKWGRAIQTLSLVDASDLTPEQENLAVSIDPEFGVRADHVVLTKSHP